MTIDGEVVGRAHLTVQAMLKDAVETAKSPDEFRANMAFCQIVATRMLSVLIYNSAIQSNQTSKEATDKVIAGVRRELEDILSAAESGALDSVEVHFDKKDQADAQAH